MTTAPILALDVDGVIIEGFPRHRWDETLKADLGIDRDELVKAFFEPHWHAIMIGEIEMVPVLSEALEKIGADVPVLEFIDYWHGRDAQVRDDVIEAAKKWANETGSRLVLATNQEVLRASYLWHGLGFKDHFDRMLVSCELKAAKPHADYFVRADEALGRNENRPVIFIDDLVENVEGASAHGWTAHHVETPDHAIDLMGRL